MDTTDDGSRSDFHQDGDSGGAPDSCSAEFSMPEAPCPTIVEDGWGNVGNPNEGAELRDDYYEDDEEFEPDPFDIMDIALSGI